MNNAGYVAFQFNPTKSGGDSFFQMSDIEFEGTDGAVIDLSDCTATATGGTSNGNEQPSNMIDSNTATKWCASKPNGIADLVLVVACNTPKTVAKFRWATADDVSRLLMPLVALTSFCVVVANQGSSPVGSIWWLKRYRAVDPAAGSDHRLSSHCWPSHILNMDSTSSYESIWYKPLHSMLAARCYIPC